MKIVIINGQNHKGSTEHIARILADKVGGEVTEFFLPHDFDEFCCGCTNCFMTGEKNCPHYEKLLPITSAIDEADLIILASPVYVYHASGAMKAFLDHYGYRWMVHRPDGKMFTKQIVCISTAVGAGMKSTNKDMADSAFFWGAARIYKLGIAVMETNWERIKPSIKKKIENKTDRLAKVITKRHKHISPALKTKVIFKIMSIMQRNGFNEADKNYWIKNGWTGKARPWNKI